MISRVMNEMIRYFKNDPRRINHALKVYGFAAAISGAEKVSEKESTVINLTAILHDIGIKEAEKKYNSTAGNYQEIEGPPIARQILENLGIDNNIIQRVCHLIGNHHSYQKINGLDFQIIVEADFLVNIFEDQMAAEAIKSIRQKYFKTGQGIALLDSIYL
jgi:HD superfamily phosphodiesterase